jgi:O-acetylhomoserine (thiol)-lyase
MTDEQLDACGVGADLIRLSCGLENTQDLIADLEQAIEKA